MAYTTIDKPSDYFNTKLYTGTDNSNAISGIGFAPDWVWIKNRGATGHHMLFDKVRGATKVMYSNLTDAETTVSGHLTSFDSDGFTLGDNSGKGSTNGNTETYVAWNWKAETSFTNDASSTGVGSIDSAGSVNTDAGFSIISYTGTGSAGTVAHGLGAVPKMIIIKSRNTVSLWAVYHQAIGNTHGLFLNATNAATDLGAYWNDTSPTSSVFSLGGDADINKSSDPLIAYCFAEKQGYSKFGSYTANNSSDGTYIHLGFKPAFFICKKSSGTETWHIHDNKRSPFNVSSAELYASENQAEDTNARLDLLSNGVKMRTDGGGYNTGSETYIYMAFAEQPFVTSTGVPATAR